MNTIVVMLLVFFTNAFLVWFGWILHARFCKKELRDPVSIHYGEDGKADGIMVQTLNDSFTIDLHDAEDGREMTWHEAMEKYEDVMPGKQRALLICVYLEEINALLEKVGGDVLNCWYWTKTRSEYNADCAWLYYGNYGCVNNNYKYLSRAVRPVRASV